MMYVQGGRQDIVQHWVDTVHDLRYKDYQLAAAVSEASVKSGCGALGMLEEVSTVRDMAAKMEEAGLTEWWRKAMGFANG